ncbi:MAG: glycosyltransferase family 2 protein [Bacteroidaceae bacterium]|nr:glycosyltransferase family 2 protein [Bacteroidaceae bacterium]
MNEQKAIVTEPCPTTQKPLVSVLMAVYNAEPFLPEALHSLLHQTLREIEVLAVDDASTDHSLAILQRTAEEDSRLRVFRHEENESQAVARNTALQYARGEYICMVDADDWLAPDALETVVAVFRDHPQTDCVVFRLVLHWQADGREEEYRRQGTAPLRPVPSCMTGEEAFRLSLDWTLHGLYAVRREIHLRYPYDTSCLLYSDDNTTHLHYLRSREVRLSSATYYYRKHPASSTMAVSPNLFLYMRANLSMKRTLEREGVAADLRAEYERCRWYNFRGQLWTYFDYKGRFSPYMQQYLRGEFREVYSTFRRPLPFPLLMASERLRWYIRRHILHA